MEGLTYFEAALAGLAALTLFLLVTTYVRASRVARGKSDPKVLLILQVLGTLVAAVGTALFAILNFLMGHPVRAILVFLLLVVSSLGMSLGKRLAWTRYGRSAALSQTESQPQERRELTQARAIMAWGFLGLMSASALLSAFMFGAFRWLFPSDPELLAAIGLLPPAMGMALAGVTIIAAEVPTRQPFALSLAVALTSAPVLLGLGAYSAWSYPGRMLQPGWTQMCAFIAVVSFGSAAAIRVGVRTQMLEASDDAQLTSASS